MFAALSSNVELRNEFRDLLAIGAAVKEDREAFVPPVAVTAAVFGTLGIATPIVANAVSSSGWWGSIISKVWIPVSTAIVSSLVTFFVVSSVNESSSNTNADAQLQQQPLTQEMQSQTVPPSQVAPTQEQVQPRIVEKIVYVKVPVVQQESTLKQVETDKQQTTTSTSTGVTASGATSHVPSTTPLANSETFEKKELEILQLADNASTFAIRQSPVVLRKNDVMPDVAPTEVYTFGDVPVATVPKPIQYPNPRVQLRGLQGWTVGLSSTASAPSSLFQNVAIAVPFDFSKNHTFGLEIGNEFLPMEFTTSGASPIKYQNNATQVWGGVFYRYNFDEIGGAIRPFVQGLVGGAEYGLVGKGITGLQYSPFNKLTMMLGAEATGLRYSYGGTTFWTPKVGITYGLSYGF